MRGVLAALCLVMLAACGGGDHGREGVATYEPQGEGGNSALLEGSLAFVGACFYLDQTEGDRLLPVFPVDSVRTAGSTLTYQGVDYSPGDELALGGGVTPHDSGFAAVAVIPPGCDAEVELWVVNQDG